MKSTNVSKENCLTVATNMYFVGNLFCETAMKFSKEDATKTIGLLIDQITIK
jgi:hypothetical protein